MCFPLTLLQEEKAADHLPRAAAGRRSLRGYIWQKARHKKRDLSSAKTRRAKLLHKRSVIDARITAREPIQLSWRQRSAPAAQLILLRKNEEQKKNLEAPQNDALPPPGRMMNDRQVQAARALDAKKTKPVAVRLTSRITCRRCFFRSLALSNRRHSGFVDVNIRHHFSIPRVTVL